ncbi:hypothetical protein VZT92_001174 [Zoarces viviparus]|uniref:Secreted protein n=1 Tax=Zoarces viviparus TaxID=48416 RepID=A0AAW1G341_ZOAVI
MPVVPTPIILMVSVPTLIALMKLVSMVNLPTAALLLPANVTPIATMFMMNRMTIATMTRHMWIDLTMIRIALSNRASLHNPMVPHLLISLPKFFLPLLNLP